VSAGSGRQKEKGSVSKEVRLRLVDGWLFQVVEL